ncbi:MAG: hypothetical protein CBB71_06600 [Rhodopirellula sp. TMED11]|nr:MAG: hypothetical protein CBB71_06600 [Rhodopirellula sp. TMED11]
MRLRSLSASIAALVLAAIAASPVSAEVKLSGLFSDHMVLQQEMPIRIFGKADAGEAVTVSFNGKQASGKADGEGSFRLELPAMKADGKPHELVVQGENTITLRDVLLGEVWICSGQSNMEWSVRASKNAQEEIAAADHPNIRLFNVNGHVSLPAPTDDPRGNWALCSPQSISGFTAVGYFFGRELNQELKVPIGLIGTNWGGTRIEPWTPPVGFDAVESLEDYRQSIQNSDAKKQPKGGATRLYNGMVHALTPVSARGAIWYQGESNAGDGLRYDYLKEALVKGWRDVFENPELSFYWVQLANFREPSDNPAGGGWGPVREGQRRALRLPKTGMAVIIDIGEAKDIHPRNKQDVGKRLALWALAKDYGKDIVYSGPLFESFKVEGNTIRVSFQHVGGGLAAGKKDGLEPTKLTDSKELTQFAVQAEDGSWHWAKATIDGDQVVVSAEGVEKPQNVRFGYQSNPDTINLYNRAGLPASPFTTVD